MFIMLFSVFFSPNIIVLGFWVFKISLFLSNQFSISLNSSLTTFSIEDELLPEAKSAVSSAKRRVLSLIHLKDHLCIGEINRAKDTTLWDIMIY